MRNELVVHQGNAWREQKGWLTAGFWRVATGPDCACTGSVRSPCHGALLSGVRAGPIPEQQVLKEQAP